MYDFKNIDEEGFSFGELALMFIAGAVRIFGFVLMLFGLWVALMVMLEALELYEQPKKIEQLAVYIERGSNIDANISAVSFESEQSSADESQTTAGNQQKQIRVSYFFAWLIAILMLLLIARIALGVIKTGGELVLYDVQIKRFAKELAKESFKLQK